MLFTLFVDVEKVVSVRIRLFCVVLDVLGSIVFQCFKVAQCSVAFFWCFFMFDVVLGSFGLFSCCSGCTMLFCAFFVL